MDSNSITFKNILIIMLILSVLVGFCIFFIHVISPAFNAFIEGIIGALITFVCLCVFMFIISIIKYFFDKNKSNL